MRMINNRILNNISSLINTNLEMRHGYKKAAEIIGDKNLKEIFVIYILKITDYINELKSLEKGLAADNKIVNHQLKDFSFQVNDHDEISVLRKCEILEENSIREYESFLNSEIPANIKEIFLRQYNGLQETCLHLRSLEDQF